MLLQITKYSNCLNLHAMKRTTLIVCLVYLFSVGIHSCKEYEEGPAFSLLTKKQRLKGERVLKTIDGDATLSFSVFEDSMYTSCGTMVPYKNETVYSSYRLEFEKDGDVEFTFNLTTSIVDYWSTQSTCTAVYDVTNDSGKSKGDWEWEDKKEDIEITLNNMKTEYEILRLTEKELKLETLTGEVWEFEKD